MVTVGFPNNFVLRACTSLGAAAALTFVSSAHADGRDSRATTEAQAQEKKEEAGVRVLGTSGLENPEDPVLRPVQAERRTVLAMGISLGASLGSAAGFPNDPTKIGLISNYTDSGIGVGFGARAWAGFALRDFLVFGGSIGTFGFNTGENVVYLGVVGFHTEIYPLYLSTRWHIPRTWCGLGNRHWHGYRDALGRYEHASRRRRTHVKHWSQRILRRYSCRP
jgi:hypothetical protein